MTKKFILPIFAIIAIIGGYALVSYPRNDAKAAVDESRNYLTIHNFNVEIDGVIVGGFKEVQGIESETEVIEFKEGEDRGLTRKQPGKTKYANIVLKQGRLNDSKLWDWYEKAIAGTTERKSGSIIVFDRHMKEVVRYNFFDAWPCRWKGPSLDRSSNEPILEEIELCIERFERSN
jgi:phage tail-like protein